MTLIYESLAIVQSQIKVPKGKKNKFGGYNYRTCADILEAAKKLLVDNQLMLVVTDEMVTTPDDTTIQETTKDGKVTDRSSKFRTYVKATAKLANYKGESIECYAYAREELNKKGMDVAQVTGAASSYARKYALCGLLCIDDTNDPDTQDNRDLVIESNFTKTNNKNLKEGVFDTSNVIKKQLDEAKNIDDLKKVWGKCNATERKKMESYKDMVKDKLVEQAIEEKKLESEKQELSNEDVSM